MINKDSVLLEKAYMSMTKPLVSVPSDEETVSLEPSAMVHTSPVSEPAPGVQMGAVQDTTTDPSINSVDGVAEPHDTRMNSDSESEEDSMVIDNLASIRESIMKTAEFCASGGHLEAWQQQKLAIAMDNLASVARSLKSGAYC